jgi:hypothetical protein
MFDVLFNSQNSAQLGACRYSMKVHSSCNFKYVPKSMYDYVLKLVFRKGVQNVLELTRFCKKSRILKFEARE